MTEEQKQAHIEAAHKWVEVMQRYIENHPQDISAPITLGLYQIALAALTAPEDWKQRAEAAESNSTYNGGGARYWHDEYCAQQQRLVSKIVSLEAELAELEKQEPVAVVRQTTVGRHCTMFAVFPVGTLFYTRPAPAADLAELVPVPPEFLSAEQNSQGMFELSEDCMTRLAIALSQQAKGLVIKPGHALVPVEPSWEMISAAIKSHEGDAFLPVSLYKSMLAAAPEVE